MLCHDFMLGDDPLRLYHSRLSIDLLLDLLLPVSYKQSFEGGL
jgi:hypothetical protein